MAENTDEDLVYGVLDFRNWKAAGQIMTEAKLSPPATSFALKQLEEEGLIEKKAGRPHSKKAPQWKWRKKPGSRRPIPDTDVADARFGQFATA